jgi:hypothetical protein
VQVEVDGAIEDWQMAQPQRLSSTDVFGRFLSAFVTNRVMLRKLDLYRDFAIVHFRTQDLNDRQVEQAFD